MSEKPSLKRLRYFLKDENKASKEYSKAALMTKLKKNKRAFRRMSKDEKTHAKLLKAMLK